MQKSIFTIAVIMSISKLPAQNLVINPDAESLPRGTGWTVLSQGALTCLLVPTNNMINWTMKPNGSVNYPFDHTTGANGGTVFFSGCDTYLTGPFELEQLIDVSTDSNAIDAGSQLYDFSGYMQTPVSNQTDMGRFVVDFMDASNTILGTSYKSAWQSNFDGSGTGWTQYTNTRTAPAGTRKVRITLQASLFINQPAINVYFDDISFSKIVVVPVGLLSFTGTQGNGDINLQWKMSGELNCKLFEIERSTDATHFNKLAVLTATGITSYQFADKDIDPSFDKYFYRLKMKAADGKTSYSNIVMIKTAGIASFTISPNPANNVITLKGLSQAGVVSIIDYNGTTMLTTPVNNSSVRIDISSLPVGLYMVRFSNQKTCITKKLFVQHN